MTSPLESAVKFYTSDMVLMNFFLDELDTCLFKYTYWKVYVMGIFLLLLTPYSYLASPANRNQINLVIAAVL